MKNWKYIEGAKTGNICSGNKKQDWDVGGNIDWDVGNFNGQWYVTKNGQKLVGPFMSMKEAERYLDGHKWELQNKYGNSKIGNTQVGNDTPWEYAHRKPKVINEEKTGAEEFFKQLSDDVKEREEKDDADIEKVGNARYTTREDVISHLDTDLYDICKKVPAGSPSFAYVSELQKKGWDISTISKYTKEIGKIIDQYKVGNASVGGGTYASDDGSKKAVVDITNLQSGSTRVVWIEDGRQTGSNEYRSLQSAIDACKRKGLKKVGNAIGGGVQSETVLTETKDGSQYWVEKTSKSGQYAQYNLYYTIGQGKRHAGVFKDKEAAADAGRRIIGNSSSNEEYWKKQYIEAARKKGISEKEIQEFVKKIEKEGPKGVMSTIKNSAPDDKFAYVMREFDEGKLKTPDGKVVTDPEQAKANAYSERKKTENGLARARKAMNKKCGNSQVTLWKGNDSVLISEDGTVQYLESNSFETDRDKYGSMQEAIDDLTKKGYRKK